MKTKLIRIVQKKRTFGVEKFATRAQNNISVLVSAYKCANENTTVGHFDFHVFVDPARQPTFSQFCNLIIRVASVLFFAFLHYTGGWSVGSLQVGNR